MNSAKTHTRPLTRNRLALADSIQEIPMPPWTVILAVWLELKGKNPFEGPIITE